MCKSTNAEIENQLLKEAEITMTVHNNNNRFSVINVHLTMVEHKLRVTALFILVLPVPWLPDTWLLKPSSLFVISCTFPAVMSTCL